MTNFNLAEFRAHFPALESGIAFFDGPGGTQTPTRVADAIANALTGPLSNRGAVATLAERNTEGIIAAFRSAFADFLNADPRGIVYGRSTTQINYDFSRHLSKNWGPGDEVVLTRLDHDSNVRPWVQAAERVGATVRWLEFDPETSELILDELDDIVNERTVLVAMTAASNLIGTKPPVRRIADRAHEVGALVHVDGVHYAAHELVDIALLGADFFVCSPYKVLGPHCAVLAASPELLETIHPDKLLPATDEVPERFEFGTLPFEVLAGATAAVDFLAEFGGEGSTRRERLAQAFKKIHAHEDELQLKLENAVKGLGERVTVYSRAADRTGTLYFNIVGVHSWDVYDKLAELGVLVPVGSFYAYEAFNTLQLTDEDGLRVGLAPYTSEAEIDRLIAGLTDIVNSL